MNHEQELFDFLMSSDAEISMGYGWVFIKGVPTEDLNRIAGRHFTPIPLSQPNSNDSYALEHNLPKTLARVCRILHELRPPQDSKYLSALKLYLTHNAPDT